MNIYYVLAKPVVVSHSSHSSNLDPIINRLSSELPTTDDHYWLMSPVNHCLQLVVLHLIS